MFMYVNTYVHVMRLYVLYDCVQCSEDTVGVKLHSLNLLLLLLLLSLEAG